MTGRYFHFFNKLNLNVSCCWALTSSSGRGRKGAMSMNTDAGSQVEDLQQSCLFNKGENPYALPALRCSDPLTVDISCLCPIC